jgi:hypothetical protein
MRILYRELESGLRIFGECHLYSLGAGQVHEVEGADTALGGHTVVPRDPSKGR